MENNVAIIFGITGQDGAYLSEFLLKKGYTVLGVSRKLTIQNQIRLKALGILNKVKILKLDINNLDVLKKFFYEINPAEIYNLAGISSVGYSFVNPVETFESITKSNLNILEAIRELNLNIKFYSACSSECFGDFNEERVTENTIFNPLSPYGLAKASSFWQVKVYRESYDIFACSGILFNHESPLRQDFFVTKKIVTVAKRIRDGSKEKLILGDLSIARDWGWAPDYVEAMWLMLQNKKADDFIICTGESHTLEEFVKLVFIELNLHWEDHVIIDKNLFRPNELKFIVGSPLKAKNQLNWESKTSFPDLIKKLLM